MKTITNTITTIKDGKGKYIDYKDLITSCVNQPKQGGFGVDDMRIRFRLLDEIEKGQAEFNFEDNDFKILTELVKSMKWNILHKDIIKFIELFD